MELEGSQNHVGRETEWRWKRDGIAVEGSWEIVGQVDGVLTGDEKALGMIYYVPWRQVWSALNGKKGRHQVIGHHRAPRQSPLFLKK